MAIEARPSATIARFPLPGERPSLSPHIPALESASRLRERVGNAMPLLGSLALISFIFWAPFHPVTASIFAFSLVAFFVYWVVRSYSVAIACLDRAAPHPPLEAHRLGRALRHVGGARTPAPRRGTGRATW